MIRISWHVSYCDGCTVKDRRRRPGPARAHSPALGGSPPPLRRPMSGPADQAAYCDGFTVVMYSPTPCRERGGPHASPPCPSTPRPGRGTGQGGGYLIWKAPRGRGARPWPRPGRGVLPLAAARPRRIPPGLGPGRGALPWPRPFLGASRGRPLPLPSVLCVAFPSPVCRGPSPSCRGAPFVPSALGHRRARSARAVRAG